MKSNKKKVVFGFFIVAAIVAACVFICHILKSLDDVDDEFFDDLDLDDFDDLD